MHLRFTASGDLHQPSISSYQIEGMVTAGQPGCPQSDPDEPAKPGVTVQDIEHVYKVAGLDRIVVTAESFCSRFSGSDTAEITIDVRP